MKTTRVVVMDEAGLHARPAAMFVQLANKFAAEITVSNLTEPADPANAKSILGVLTCGVKQGHEIEIQAQGEDEEAAIAALQGLVTCGFAEEAEAEKQTDSGH